jgi:hypothetical protein
MKEKVMESGKIVIYQTQDGQTSIDVTLDKNTVWLTQAQMVDLFESTKQNVSLHIKNIFKEGELDKNSTVKDSLTVQKEGKRTIKRTVEQFSLDVIISTGYRIKSWRGTQFRIWANKVLKEYLVQGYALNEKRLSEQSAQLDTLKQTVQAVEIIQELLDMNRNSEYLFLSYSKPWEPMCKNTMLVAIKRMGYNDRMTGHGFRSLALGLLKEKLDYFPRGRGQAACACSEK